MPTEMTELMHRVRRIRIATGRKVDERFCGAYRSVFRGRGIEFDAVRPYVPGDDVRGIDWNVTARMGHPYVKRYVEERELTVLFAVDISGSQRFGSAEKTKSELCAEVTALLSLSAVRNQDRVGLVLFSDRIEHYLPARKGRTAVMRLVRDVLAAGETLRPTAIREALGFLNRVQRRRAVVFLISDFRDDAYETDLRLTAHHHDLVCCVVADPRENELAPAGLIDTIDPESGRRLLLDTDARRLRRRYARDAQRRREALWATLRRCGVDAVALDTTRPFVEDFRRLFERRRARRR